TILEESSRLSRLINNLLDLEEMEHGEVGMDMEEIDLSRVIDRVRNIIKPLAESLNVDVIYDVRSVKIMGDYDRLIQALLNIIDNAVKYTSQKVGGEKKVFVNLQEDEKNAIIEVRDTGPGIPSDAIPRLFERFYRVDKARSRKLGGTGLGLSIAKFIVEKHGGRIEVQSKRGEGSTFRIILPKVVMENESV
ncbi:MAG TPA: GHKL domain-containing protein, partial [Thermotogales bacterium]|nr:GHKL domain-containing protein [Thermotogales bacterium]